MKEIVPVGLKGVWVPDPVTVVFWSKSQDPNNICRNKNGASRKIILPRFNILVQNQY